MNRTSRITLMAAIFAACSLVPACAPDLAVRGSAAPGDGCKLDAECTIGFCVDGVCCDNACTSACHSCNQPDALGRCTTVPMGSDDCAAAGELCNDNAICACGVSIAAKNEPCPFPWIDDAPGACRLDCGIGGPCDSSEITCPAGFHCTIWCSGVDSCNMKRIACPEGTECSVVCTGPSSCQSLQMQCSTTGPCTLGCGAALGACQGAQIQCGTNACAATCEGTEKPEILRPMGAPCSVNDCSGG